MTTSPEPPDASPPPRPRLGGAGRVAAGILSSRVMGLVREVTIAGLFGVGGHADVLAAAFRGPNLLQNLLGEQTLSASFIPVYSRLIEAGREEEAGRFAGAVFGLLLAAAAALAALGVLLSGPVVALLAPGFLGDAAEVAAGTATVDRYPLAVAAVRFLFPMSAVLALSAWTLGVLNSHRRFFLPYFAPVLWNGAILAALFAAVVLWGAGGGAETRDRLLLAACAGALAGGLLQFGVQVPVAAKLLTGFRLSLSTRVAGVRESLRAFAPLVAARGVVQLSGYLDLLLGSLLAAGALGALRWAQTLYLLPIALFAMSVAAAELPELARKTGADDEAVGRRATAALRRIAFLVLPTIVGYLAFGYLLVGALFRRGSFGVADNWLVYLVLCGYTLGLFATTWSRLLQNVFYARSRTRTPARIAVLRVAVSAAAGLVLMRWLDRVAVAEAVGLPAEGPDLRLGALGLALGAALGAWLEFALLRRALAREARPLALPGAAPAGMLGLAVVAALPAAGLAWALEGLPVPARGLAVVVGYALVYLGLARVFRLREAASWRDLFGR